jgi:lysyl-tRNA synthetase class 2
LPLPEKWHGLQDVEIRYRQRYLDLISNPEAKRTFVARSHMVQELRGFMDRRGFVEVETPMMQPIAGGAVARPFVTHHNALDIDLYLRIAPELYLKRLVVGGLERVYEINKNFRNEGIDSQHNPEFTMLEFYDAYADCQQVMRTTEELIAAAAARIAGGRPITYKQRPVSFALPFARVSMTQAVINGLREAGFKDLRDDDFKAGSETDLRARLQLFLAGRLDLKNYKGASLTWGRFKDLSRGRLLAQLFEDFAEASFWDPTYVVDHPTEISPLAKQRPDDPGLTERFELFVAGGMEIANGFSELNDPLEQRQRFLDQLKQREKGDDEAHVMDDDYVRALGHGLPPTGGCGVGIDRLAMVLTDSPSIRDVILFPQMRPEGGR